MNAQLALFLAVVAFTLVMVGAAVVAAHLERRAARAAARRAWGEVAARRGLRLLETRRGDFELHGAVGGAELVLYQAPLAHGVTGMVLHARGAGGVGARVVVEPEAWPRGGPARPPRRVPTGDAEFDALYRVYCEDAAAAHVVLDARVRDALLRVPSAWLAYEAGALRLVWPWRGLDVDDDVLDAAFEVVAAVCRG